MRCIFRFAQYCAFRMDDALKIDTCACHPDTFSPTKNWSSTRKVHGGRPKNWPQHGSLLCVARSNPSFGRYSPFVAQAKSIPCFRSYTLLAHKERDLLRMVKYSWAHCFSTSARAHRAMCRELERFFFHVHAFFSPRCCCSYGKKERDPTETAEEGRGRFLRGRVHHSGQQDGGIELPYTTTGINMYPWYLFPLSSWKSMFLLCARF